jgi:hypothetical protein
VGAERFHFMNGSLDRNKITNFGIVNLQRAIFTDVLLSYNNQIDRSLCYIHNVSFFFFCFSIQPFSFCKRKENYIKRSTQAEEMLKVD